MSQDLHVNTKTKIASLADAQRSLQELQKNFNLLVERITSPAEKELKETEGSSGDIQITRNHDDTYTFEVRTEDGWKTPVLGDSVVHFKGKPKTFSKKQDKTIDEIEVDDISTGAKVAEKTIYDEKSSKFVLPRADYDSGWWTWDASETRVVTHDATVFNHNLGAIPSQCRIWFAPDGSINGGTSGNAIKENPTISLSHGTAVDTSIIKWAIPIPATPHVDHDFGLSVFIDTDTFRIIGGTDSYTTKSTTFASNTPYSNYADGYMRILLWK